MLKIRPEPMMSAKSTMMALTREGPPKNQPTMVQMAITIPRGKKDALTLPRALPMHLRPKNEGYSDAYEVLP